MKKQKEKPKTNILWMLTLIPVTGFLYGIHPALAGIATWAFLLSGMFYFKTDRIVDIGFAFSIGWLGVIFMDFLGIPFMTQNLLGLSLFLVAGTACWWFDATGRLEV